MTGRTWGLSAALLAAAVGCGRSELAPTGAIRGPADAEARSDAAVPDLGGPDAGADPCDRPDREIVIAPSREGFDLSAELGALAGDETIRVTVPAGVTVSGVTPRQPAFTTGALPLGVRVCLRVEGQIVGHGGAGGSGGTGALGRATRPCGRDGERGGTAIEFLSRGRIDVAAGGLVGGGGGGGGGASGCDLNAGGGGGAGAAPGAGGEASSGLAAAPEVAFCGEFRGVYDGAAGEPGSERAGGAGGVLDTGQPGFVAIGGRGGDLGRDGAPGESCQFRILAEGGRAGFSIVLGPRPVEIRSDGDIIGPVD